MHLIPDVRFQIVKWAIFGVDDQRQHGDWHYQEVRPFHLAESSPHILDCSAFCIWTYWKAGARDPSGLNFSGWGNSDSFFARGRHIAQNQVHPGDIIVFGPGGSVHAVVVVQMGPDPLCASLGQQGDPSLVRLSVLESLGAPTFLRFPTRNRRIPLLTLA